MAWKKFFSWLEKLRACEKVEEEKEQNVAVFGNGYPAVSSCYTAHAKKQSGHVSVRMAIVKKMA